MGLGSEDFGEKSLSRSIPTEPQNYGSMRFRDHLGILKGPLGIQLDINQCEQLLSSNMPNIYNDWSGSSTERRKLSAWRQKG